jgi:two-component system, LytTR family, sensor histidine kinase AlgZ
MLSSTSAPAKPDRTPALPRMVRNVGLNAAAWTVLSALGALTSLNDDLRGGTQGDYWIIFGVWMRSSLVLAIQSALLYALFTWRPAWIASGKRIALAYGAMLLVLLPPQMLFLLKLYVDAEGPGLSWAALEQAVGSIDQFGSLLRFSTTTAVFFAVVGLKSWQLAGARQRDAEQARADSRLLRLELAQQKALALRAQLEPHFMFNALAALSALVREQRADSALDAIHGLGELLRYALAAGDREWTSLAGELDFVEQYLALQRLRYGGRLQLRIDGLGPEMLSSDIPPLLLQPLVENALRHDLDCHTGPSDILLSFQLQAGQLHIQISNPLRDAHPANAGAGLGLRTMMARIESAYQGRASLNAAPIDGRFVVDLSIPQYAVD